MTGVMVYVVFGSLSKMMFEIQNEDISVVFQGPIVSDSVDETNNYYTRKCIDSVRKYLPGAKIILSSWVGSDTAGIDCDCIVLNEDPGGFPLFIDSDPVILNNVNRQIVSTLAGLKKVDTQYAFKLRTDIALTGDGFLNYFDKFSQFGNYKILNKKVLSCNLFSRNPRLEDTPMPLHPSDWIFFGETLDVLNIWNIPLISEKEKNYFTEASPCSHLFWKNLKARFFPEQFIWESFVMKHVKIKCQHAVDSSPEMILLSEAILADNLVVLSPSQLGVDISKIKVKSHYLPNRIYTHQDWRRLYNTYCNAKIFIYPWDIQKIYLHLKYVFRQNCGKIYTSCLQWIKFKMPIIYIFYSKVKEMWWA